MSMQNESKDVRGNTDQQKPGNNTGNIGSVGTGDSGAMGEAAARQGSQQAEMPPSETDDDQYDQGTVKRAP
jgi:hypothetical protein